MHWIFSCQEPCNFQGVIFRTKWWLRVRFVPCVAAENTNVTSKYIKAFPCIFSGFFKHYWLLSLIDSTFFYLSFTGFFHKSDEIFKKRSAVLCTEQLPPTEPKGGSDAGSFPSTQADGRNTPRKGLDRLQTPFHNTIPLQTGTFKTFQLPKEITRNRHINGTSLNGEVTVQNKDSKAVKFWKRIRFWNNNNLKNAWDNKNANSSFHFDFQMGSTGNFIALGKHMQSKETLLKIYHFQAVKLTLKLERQNSRSQFSPDYPKRWQELLPF